MLSLEKLDQLQNALGQLAAGVQLTFGGAGDSFREASAEIQEYHLSAISEKIDFCRELVKTA